MINYPTVKDNLEKYIDASFPILYICTFEETKVDECIFNIVRKNNLLKKVKEWNGVDGLVGWNMTDKNSPIKVKSMPPILQLEKALDVLISSKAPLNQTLLVIKDAAEQLSSITASLKDIAYKIRNSETTAAVVIVAPTVKIPPELEKIITILELGYPDEKEIGAIIEEFIGVQKIPAPKPELMDELTRSLKGLTEFEIEDLLSLAIRDANNQLTENSKQLIFEQKRQMIKKTEILEYISHGEKKEDIGGLDNLKEWLEQKAKVFEKIEAAKEFGVAVPKGALIVGVPGCGKSLCAKVTGKMFDVPLLRLDMGRLMGKFVGESEENMRKAIQQAEAIAPCVLWVDELEKAFAGVKGDSNGGSEVTTRRMFGTFLTWMQEKTSLVFVLATANKIAELPPELLRKGRFDEIFYVDLPNDKEREAIFKIHIEKHRKADIDKIDIAKLAKYTTGYSGADIEGVVCESVENVFVKHNGEKGLTTEDIQKCREETQPLSKIMEKEINDIRSFCNARKFRKASSK
jgi:SpoVK/Ycf46/Vps4 family AAA+-type ATPase